MRNLAFRHQKRKLKIMILTPGLPPWKIGGEEYYSYYQAKTLLKLGHLVHVVTYDTGNAAKKLLKRIVKTVESSDSLMHYPMACIHLACSAIFRHKCRPDLIHAHDTYAEGMSAIILGKILRVPVIITWHGAELIEKGKNFSTMGNISRRLVCSLADAIIVPSNQVRSSIIERSLVDPTKISVIPPGVDTSFFRPIEETDGIKQTYDLNDSRVILTVGRLNKIKGVDLVIQALPHLTKKFPDLKLLIVGDGPELSALKELASRLEMENHVFFTGFVDRELLPHFYSSCDIFVLPTRGEGFGLVYMEAWACGKPIITTYYAPEIVNLIKEVGGGLVTVNDPEELNKMMAKLLSDSDLRMRMGEEGRKIVTSWYSWDSVIKRNVDLYYKYLGKESSSAEDKSKI